MLEIQREISDLFRSHLKHQEEVLENQRKKERVDEVSVKLPKLELLQFDGNKMKWLEFWDSFESAIHRNKQLSEI